MRMTRYFAPTLREDPSDAQVVSHRLMVRAGMIRMVTAGIYNYLPLALKVMRKVETIVREEMNAAGALEILMPMVQPAELWQETGRWSKYDAELLRIKDRHQRDFCLGPTHEEIVTDIFRKNVQSYKNLPINLYQIQTKFRDEVRPRFGLMRGREFVMKDAYSFDMSEEMAMKSYENMRAAYTRIFTRLGLDWRMVTADSGNIGGNFSHEFHVLAGSGEDTLIFDTEGAYAVNIEKHDAASCGVPANRLKEAKGIEVGHIFLLKDVYSKPMKAEIPLPDGTKVPVVMGCYGIGVSRIVAAAIEQNHDAAGIVWPAALAPFDVSLLNMRATDDACKAAAEKLYADWTAKGLDILYDDRDETAGIKFADADLLGNPWQCVVGPKSLKEGLAEWKNRRSGEKFTLPLGELPPALSTRTAKAA
jgi:prolyl-tRNA synthetase